MGNGRWPGRSSNKGREQNSHDRKWEFRALGILSALLVAASFLTVLSSGRGSHTANFDGASPLGTASESFGAKPAVHTSLNPKAALAQLPLIFEPNQGQTDSKVKFLARGAGYGFYLNETGAVLALQTAPTVGKGPGQRFVRMNLAGARREVSISGSDRLPGQSNYFIGNDPKRWHSGVPQFAAVRYERAYPGIDLVFYGNSGHLEYDFRIAPGSDPAQAMLEFEGAKLELRKGDLIVTGGKENEAAAVRLQAPQIYQLDGNRRQPVDGRFVIKANRVGFEVGAYDRSRELVIDPVLQFSTYFGGSGSETSPSVAVNGDGFIYLSGTTSSPPASFQPVPLNGTVPTQIGTGTDIFVAKISPAQPPAVLYTTFLGGSGTDTSVGLGVDGAGNAFVVGNTTSADFPTTSLSYQTQPATKGTQCASVTCTSVFVSGLNPAGSALNYSSYLSGNGNDQASAMAIDIQQEVFVTGTTTSNNAGSSAVAFPATQLPIPFQSTPLSSIQFFVTKINTRNPGVGGIAYSTYFGGSVPANPVAIGGGITVDSTGNIYFSGTTNFYNSGSGLFGTGGSGDFPILNPYQPCLDTPPATIVTNANPCTPPTATPYPTDAFVAKINPLAQAGSQLIFSTYFGGTGSDSSSGIAVDTGAANVYFTGSTNSSDFVIPTSTASFQACLDTPPVTPPIPPPCPTITAPAPFDAYVARFTNPALSTTGTPNTAALTYFSYLGGSGNDSGAAIAVDTAGDALLTGATSSSNFPVTTGPIQSTLNGTQNAFFAHIDTTTVTTNNEVGSYSSYFGGNGSDRGTSIAVDPTLNSYFAGDTTSSSNFPVDDPLQSTLNGPSDAFVVKLGTAADLCITCVTPTISPTGTVSAGNTVTVTYTVSNNGPDVATGIIVTGLVPTGVTVNSASASGGSCSPPSGNTVVCQIATLQVGSVSTVTLTVTPTAAGTYQATATVSSANDTNTNNSATAPITASGFTVTITPSAQTTAAGTSAQYTVVVAPTQGVFGSNISLTCSALPAGAACNFTTSTITLTGGAGSASTILNLSTTAQPVTTGAASRRGPLYAFWLMVPGGIALFGWGAGKSRRNRLFGLAGILIFFVLVLLQPACHSSKTQPTVSGTPSGTYPLSVTATSGTLTETAPFSLTVIP